VAIVVLDTSVVIEFLDAGDSHHAAAVAALAASRGEQFVLPARRMPRSSSGRIAKDQREWQRSIGSWPISPCGSSR
jgi:hypothetical protein